MKTIKILILCSFSTLSVSAQTNFLSLFPKSAFNSLGINHSSKNLNQTEPVVHPQNNSSAFQMLKKMEEIKKTNWENYTHASNYSRTADTIIVGLVPHDTMLITGTFNHDGPIWIFNDGVVIFYNAIAVNTGDIIVFQHGSVLSESSSLTFPQTYFYQRSIIVVQHGIAYFSNTSFNYSGLQHNLIVGDSAQTGFVNVHQNDWTTAGVFGSGTLWMNGVNLGGEFILTDTANTYFNNVDSLLLWHHLPGTSVINYAFPNGSSVMGYQFNNSIPGINGINYNVYADSCQTVWWGLMPENGSDVTISNSDIRAVGCWFMNGDTATVNGVYNNTTYPNTVMPFTDRNMHLINTHIATWSLYLFDNSSINLYNSTIGEVGTQQNSVVNSHDFLLDGSGGYFWATDSSLTVASNVMIYSTARSEKNGLFILGYSTMPFSTPTAIGNSIFISTQNNLPVDPVPYDAATMWMQNIELPNTAHSDSMISVTGSEWIDQGPTGGRLFYQDYSLYYQLAGATSWTPIIVNSSMEIHHTMLGTWNTNGLAAGTYLLRLIVRDTYIDSVEAYKAVTILPAVITGINDSKELAVSVFPNPANDHLTLILAENNALASIRISDMMGKSLITTSVKELQNNIDISDLSSGTYMLEIRQRENVIRKRFVKK